jgi:hypothetical protein
VSQIGEREVEERQKLHNLHIEHVAIQSELEYLIGAENMGLLGPMKNEALLQVKPAKTRGVSVRFRVGTACDWAVRFLGGFRTGPGPSVPVPTRAAAG